ncbi:MULTISPECIES: DUF3122 domain-containing protein [unclassified Nostoc]|uniref:DUF3122 domain-containing protein n=1 Tax=unclassified Nostoc TaxID=2593658 RepID=UPI0013CFD8A7|nr:MULTISPECIES: DUF3122 domain-containing protein [unclassified Nostoc]MBE8998881.1 DUF3122 domain-containing protein [Nostoc sp. LEGE 12447]NEU84434.1 DUF3122 domain-containing protein [Nostoc sp. UIC 10630]
MLRRILKIFWWLLLLAILTIYIYLGLATFTSQQVIAAVMQLEDTPEEILYRSQEKLNDELGNYWQVILFKRVNSNSNKISSINLRLVGFPGSQELPHPLPLKITTDTGKVLTAPDIFLDEAPAPTIAQYDFKNVLPQLSTQELLIGIPVGKQHFINLSIPKYIVQEWQEIALKS